VSYHDLSECTLSPEERYKEAEEIIQMISEVKDFEDLSESEQSMINSVQHFQICSVKQLFWLRDIKDKYL
jgi:CBS domain containing-hemolysin-like protein